MLVLIFEFVLINGGHAVDSPMIWNLEQIDGLREGELAVGPSAVQCGDFSHRLFVCPGVPIIKDFWPQVFAPGRRIVFFPRGDERGDDVGQFCRDLGFFRRRMRSGSAMVADRFAVRESAEARQEQRESEKA